MKQPMMPVIDLTESEMRKSAEAAEKAGRAGEAKSLRDYATLKFHTIPADPKKWMEKRYLPLHQQRCAAIRGDWDPEACRCEATYYHVKALKGRTLLKMIQQTGKQREAAFRLGNLGRAVKFDLLLTALTILKGQEGERESGLSASPDRLTGPTEWVWGPHQRSRIKWS